MENQAHKIMIMKQKNILIVTKLSLLLGSLMALILLDSCGGDDDPDPSPFNGTVSGTVTDALSSNPLPGVNVELKQGGSTVRSTTTNSEGNYSMQEQVLGQEVFSITASLNGYESKTINEFTLAAGNQTHEADIQLDPLTPGITVEYPGGLSSLNLRGSQLIGSVTVKNDGQGTLEYTNLESPAWMDARNAGGTKSGSINGGGNAATITITVIESEIAKLGLNDGQSVEGKVLIATDQTVTGTKEIDVVYTFEGENKAPTGEISITPTGPFLMRQEINFEAINLSDDNDTESVLEVSWQFADGEGFSAPTTTKTTSTIYNSPGTFVVTLKIIDSEGLEGEDTETVIVSPNEVPFGGSFSTNLNAADLFVNNEITFTATNWNDDQTGELNLLNYSWDFGDGTTTGFSASNSSVTHTYSSASTFAVTLSVRDLDDGVGTASNNFTIKSVEQPSVTTTAATGDDVGSNYAVLAGSVSDLGNGSSGLTAHGFVYSTSTNPTVDSNDGIADLGSLPAVGNFSTRIEGLTATTTYFVRAFATNESGTPEYGNQVDFKTTIPTAPNPVDVISVTDITQTTASVEVSLNNVGLGVSLNEIGVVVNTSVDPDLSNFLFKESNSTPQVGSNIFSLTGLSSGQAYRLKAYLITSDGEVLSSTKVFITN